MENFDTIIESIKTAWSDAEKQLSTPAKVEAPIIEELLPFEDQIRNQFLSAFNRAIEGANNFKIKDPSTHMYVHYEEFPEPLYNKLLQDPASKEKLENLGFKFYMTHNGTPHPMVTFVLRF